MEPEKSINRILFVRIGRMIYYAGPRKGDEMPKGAGKYNEEGHLGHEAFNFFDFDGLVYGTFGIIAENIGLDKIDPTLSEDAKSVGEVLVVFFTPRDDGRPQQIVGWYQNAIVRREMPYPAHVMKIIQQHLHTQVERYRQQGTDSVAVRNAQFNHYRLEAKWSDAVLLPELMRRKGPVIPWGSGGTGQSNVCYAYEKGGLKPASWIQASRDFVTHYSGPTY